MPRVHSGRRTAALCGVPPGRRRLQTLALMRNAPSPRRGGKPAAARCGKHVCQFVDSAACRPRDDGRGQVDDDAR